MSTELAQVPVSEETQDQPKQRFRPTTTMINSKGRQMPYLTTKQRVLWFLDDHPDGSIETTLLDHSPDHAIFKCHVSYPLPLTESVAYMGIQFVNYTGHGSETKGDFPDYIEKAETKAVGRALANAGYGTEALDEGHPVDAPRPDGPTREGGPTPSQVKQIKDLQQLLKVDDDVVWETLDFQGARETILRLRAALTRSNETR